MAGDIYYNNVSLLLHCDGTNGSTTFTDNAPTPKVATPVGNAQISTAQSKFGGASAVFDGAGDYLTLDGSSGFSFGTGDFTIEAWFRTSALGLVVYLYDSRAISTNGPRSTLQIKADNKLVYIRSGSQTIPGTTVLSVDTWYHAAVCRSGTSTRLFLNGVQEGSTDSSDSTDYTISAARPFLGASSLSPGADSFNGHLDDIRVTKGIARYTSNFTAPTEAFPNSLPKEIIGNTPLTTSVLSTLNRKTNISGGIPVTTIVTSGMHLEKLYAITGSIPLTVNPASPAHRRARYFVTETVAITTTVAAALIKYHNTAIVGAIPVTTSVNAILLEQHRSQITGGVPLTTTVAAGFFFRYSPLAIENTLPGLQSEITLEEYPSLAVEGTFPSLSNEFEITGGIAIENTLAGFTPDIEMAAQDFAEVEGILAGFDSEFEIVPWGDAAISAMLPGLEAEIELSLKQELAIEATLGLQSDITFALATEVILEAVLPGLQGDIALAPEARIEGTLAGFSSEIIVVPATDFGFSVTFPGLAGEVTLEASIEMQGTLAGFGSDIQIVKLATGEIVGLLIGLQGDIKLDEAGSFSAEGKLPGFIFEGMAANDIGIDGTFPRMRADLRFDTLACSTSYL